MQSDAWSTLRSRTTARIALGRAGASLPTAACLAFAADHADARDAVYSELDIPALQGSLAMPVIELRTRATDRATYLQRPDLGRRLDVPSAEMIASAAGDEIDVALIVADGLSATAAQLHAAPVVHQLIELVRAKGFSLGPVCVVRQARVAVQDEIGAILRARIAVILIGERPGLGLADSLGAYLVYRPEIGKTDAQRNCVSNIHPRRLSPTAAAITLGWLIEHAMKRQLSGVVLKDERTVFGSFAEDPVVSRQLST